MSIVTLLTDSGQNDHYVAAIKATLLSINPGVRIVDITHSIAPCDIAHAAFVLRSVFRAFPKNSVHLVGVHATGNAGDKMVAAQVEDHFFVGVDNGLFSLISDQPFQHLVELNIPKIKQCSTFPERDIFAPAAVQLASQVAISDLGSPLPQLRRMIDRQIKATKKQITGHVIHVDNFGNLITNIPQSVFETLSEGKSYLIQFAGEKFRRIHTNYHQADDGECFLLFNSLGFLEIGINKGHASELLGLSYDSAIYIFFEE